LIPLDDVLDTAIHVSQRHNWLEVRLIPGPFRASADPVQGIVISIVTKMIGVMGSSFMGLHEGLPCKMTFEDQAQFSQHKSRLPVSSH
jgi:hypothetical protein